MTPPLYIHAAPFGETISLDAQNEAPDAIYRWEGGRTIQ